MPAGSDWLGPLAPALRPAAQFLEPAVFWLLGLPPWSGWALIAFGLLFVALGKHGQRPLLGLVCALGFYQAAIVLGLAKVGPSGAPPAIALGVAALGAALGALLPSWTRGLLFGGVGAFLGQLLAVSLGLPALAGAMPLAILFFMVAFVNEAAFAVGLPPLGAAVAIVVGALISLPLQFRGEHRFLTDPAALLIAAFVLLVVLLPIGIEREARSLRRQQEREQSGEDLHEKAQRAAQKAVFEAAAERAKAERAASGRPTR